MLCPFCLASVRFVRQRYGNQRALRYLCPRCRESIPALYVQGYRHYPPVVVSAIGFRGHGKTVYFTSLFYVLKRLVPVHDWPHFFSLGLDEASLETVYDSVAMLESGVLPDSTPKTFPRPTLLRLEGVPMQRNCTLLCYDTAGECFERPTQLVQFASFVRRARTALLLISMPDLQDGSAATHMQRLLNTYIVGMGQLGARPRDQHLVVVFTKADEVASYFTSSWDDLRTYLTTGGLPGLEGAPGYLARLEVVSAGLEAFVTQEIQATAFVHLARQYFCSVTFAMVSSLGARPQGQRLPVAIVPRGVLDPLLWTIHTSFPDRRQRWQRWWQRQRQRGTVWRLGVRR